MLSVIFVLREIARLSKNCLQPVYLSTEAPRYKPSAVEEMIALDYTASPRERRVEVVTTSASELEARRH